MECSQGTCDKVEDLYNKSRDAALKIKGKVSWKHAGVTVIALLSVIVTITLFCVAAEKKQDEKIAEVPVIQRDIEYIKQNMDKMDKKLDVVEIKREEDVKALYVRITTTEDKILKAIEGVKK